MGGHECAPVYTKVSLMYKGRRMGVLVDTHRVPDSILSSLVSVSSTSLIILLVVVVLAYINETFLIYINYCCGSVMLPTWLLSTQSDANMWSTLLGTHGSKKQFEVIPSTILV
ncbi:uncharacterized protein EV420DRAFT_1642782 [Desarmillaria tabescens]|uniref:Uncharacterized protein n=1 Tax=Armillaria tabescens TaxID=1929756 RepID=A0AA39KC47_ARMTA|nr:uncharacterized protein EV420DRAFT_1642782 [Desarmillaria tabescens]KAK0458436.1 hypothetical protein EV420DRAFT_1642782 [Desarmillaria tabescens]